MRESFSTLIIDNNPALADLKLSWKTAEYTAVDGLGPMRSLNEAGDSIIAVAKVEDDGTTIIGSGVMVGPGLLLTATHILEEFPRDGKGLVFLTFLPHAVRAWLPHDLMTVSGKSDIDESRRKVSDLSLVSCTLNSVAHQDISLNLAPMQVSLPLIGERLWAFGFRHQLIDNGAASIIPFVSSGIVTAAFPNGRGERMPSSCFEVNMDTLGGMSGGPVFNSDGYLVGIVSSSFEGGPSYITLIWEALRFSVRGTIPKLLIQDRINLLQAKNMGLAKINGKVSRKIWGDVVLTLSDDEMRLFVDSSDPFLIEKNKMAFDHDQLDKFIENYGSALEETAAHATIESLKILPPPSMQRFLIASGVPSECLDSIQNFSVEVFEGVEDYEIISTEKTDDSKLMIKYFYDLRIVIWTIEVPEKFYHLHEMEFHKHFMNTTIENGVATMEILQRCYFIADMAFDQDQEEFLETSIIWSAVKLPTKRGKLSQA